MENEMKNSFRAGYNKGVGFGIILILLGSVFLGLRTGFIPQQLESVILSWPMILIFIGIVNLFKRHWISGIIFLVVGNFFLVPRIIEVYPNAFPGLNVDFVHIYWPLLFILAGLLIILQRILFPQWGIRTSEKWHQKHWHAHHHHHQRYDRRYAERMAGSNGFSKNSIFGGGDHIVLDPEFKGGEMNAVFGGITLDLRRTSLPEGETVLDINAIFGGVTIYLPSEWFVEMNVDTVFGGFQDNREPKEPTDVSRKLVITGACVFGGGELRN